MTLHKIFDAAYPPKSIPAGCTGVMGYIGGANAYRTWTLADWAPFSGIRQFPVWVPDVHGSSTPAEAGRMAVAAADARAWVSSGGSRIIVCDLETTVDAVWYRAFAESVNAGGYYCVCYGSASTVKGNGASNVMTADYDGVAQLPAGTVGKQYEANAAFGGTQVDYSVVGDWFFTRGGTGPRREVK
jgi:hypothetical protein